MEVSYNGGATWNSVLQFDNADVLDGTFRRYQYRCHRNRCHRLGAIEQSNSGNMKFRFGFAERKFRLDGRRQPQDHWRNCGIALPRNLQSNDLELHYRRGSTLTVTIDKTSMNENGGTAIGTVTRTSAMHLAQH